jgi:hypothetical protein
MLEGTAGRYWGLLDDATREPKFHWGEPVSNHPEWRLEAGLGIGIAFLVFVAAWLSVPRHKPEPIDWRKGFVIASIAATSGLVFGSAALGISMEPPEFGDQLRSAGMFALSLLVPIVAGIGVARSARLEGLAVALNTSLRRRSATLGFIIACLFAATLVAAIHVALGLVFDPRYKDFQFALLSGPIAALAILALVSKPLRVATGVAEWVTAALLTGTATFIIANEGIANWQALWLGGLLLALAFTALRSASSPS